MYQAELAEIYDELYVAGVAKDYAAEAADIASLVKQRNPDAATLLDVACGTGEHLVHLRDHFSETAGVELSEEMAAIARAKGVPVEVGDMRDFDLGRTFDAVTCLFSSIGYVSGLDELHAAAHRFAAHLNPGGVLILEPWFTPDEWTDRHVSHNYAEVGGRLISRMGFSTKEGRSSIMQMHYLVASPESGIKHFADRHVMTLFTDGEYTDALTGFTDIEKVAGWREGRPRIIATRALATNHPPQPDSPR